MEIPRNLLCLFTTRIEERDGSYIIEIPEQELRTGTIDADEAYSVGVFGTEQPTTTRADEPARESDLPGPPVESGDELTVEIENIGDQGDGITRVERGYVVIVPDTDTGERVRIRITDVQESVAFAEVTERLSYYE